MHKKKGLEQFAGLFASEGEILIGQTGPHVLLKLKQKIIINVYIVLSKRLVREEAKIVACSRIKIALSYFKTLTIV